MQRYIARYGFMLASGVLLALCSLAHPANAQSHPHCYGPAPAHYGGVYSSHYAYYGGSVHYGFAAVTYGPPVVHSTVVVGTPAPVGVAVGVAIAPAPPPPVAVVAVAPAVPVAYVPPPPAPGVVWVEGSYRISGGASTWVPGHWEPAGHP